MSQFGFKGASIIRRHKKASIGILQARAMIQIYLPEYQTQLFLAFVAMKF